MRRRQPRNHSASGRVIQTHVQVFLKPTPFPTDLDCCCLSQIPGVVTLQVTEAAPGAKGNTAGGRTEKPVTLGASLQVPMFIEEGGGAR